MKFIPATAVAALSMISHSGESCDGSYVGKWGYYDEPQLFYQNALTRFTNKRAANTLFKIRFDFSARKIRGSFNFFIALPMGEKTFWGEGLLHF
jgi:hypothetical protein